MGFAKPIVASRVFGIPELVRDEVDALLVEPGDIESLCKAIDRLLSDPIMAKEMGESARLRAEEKFSLERCVEDFSVLFDELLDDSTGASH
jgi:glycosyltransferase involved in cell wall biosynthesis